MEIKSKNELCFCIKADRMMNTGKFGPSFSDRIKNLLFPDYRMRYLYAMRKSTFYKNGGGISRIFYFYWYRKYTLLGLKLGYTIPLGTIGYGVVIPHHGTIVIGSSNQIGNYAVLHTSTCISSNGKQIGNGLYLSTGVKMTSQLILGDNVSIGANSLVNKSFPDGNVMIAGAPAKIIKPTEAWYVRDGFTDRVQRIEALKTKMNLNL